MALLTAQQADRIVQANFETSGATSEALMAAWRGIVFAILERMDLGSYRRDIIMLARDIVNLWCFVQPARTYGHDHAFAYPDTRAAAPIGFFDELHRLAMAVLLASPELPPRDEPERTADVQTISDIAQFARQQRDAIDAQMHGEDCSHIRLDASTLTTSAGCCHTLLRVTLGTQFARQFQQQYDECVSAWTIAIPLVQEYGEYADISR